MLRVASIRLCALSHVEHPPASRHTLLQAETKSFCQELTREPHELIVNFPRFTRWVARISFITTTSSPKELITV